MKVYTEFVFNMNTGKEISSSSYDYDGEVALCKGGGGKGGGTQYVAPEPAPEKAQTKSIDESQVTARENQRQKAKRANGIRSTILTQQNQQNQTAGNTLLGQ